MPTQKTLEVIYKTSKKKNNGNHIKEYVVLYSGYVGIQNIKSSKEKKGIWIQKVNSL